jgi:hypothetical protein
MCALWKPWPFALLLVIANDRIKQAEPIQNEKKSSVLLFEES